MTTHHIDARKLLCPMPVIKLQNLMKHCEKGDHIHIVCTDPGCQQDIPTWCRLHGHTLQTTREENNAFFFSITVS